MKKNSIVILLFACVVQMAMAQVQGTDKRYIRIGALQSLFSAYGSERAWNNVYYEGLIWPADYFRQDNAVIQRSWTGCSNFVDKDGGSWEKYVVYYALDYVGNSLFPVKMEQSAKFEPPTVFVDGLNITAPYAGDIDRIDPNQSAERIVTNVVNTSMGVTMTRKIYAFSQQYHNNYFIKEYTFTNTGNVDYDGEIELNKEIKGFRISWGTRYAVSRDGGEKIGDGQVWGKHTWVSKRGEDYSMHAGEKITELNPIVQWLRCGFAWSGQAATNAFDNIGGPDLKGNGRLASPQHAGTVVLHVDKSPTDKSDDPAQPRVLGWHAGDSYPGLGAMTVVDQKAMIQAYDMISGIPYGSLGGNERMDEKYMAQKPDPSTIHNDGGGTNIWICYGPYDLQPGQSVTIIEAEGVAGLDRQQCEAIGKRWKQAYDNANDKGPFTLPTRATTTNKDEYKNAWIYTGKDSVLLTFGRAKRNFEANYQIPQPPQPPALVDVKSGGDRITVSWAASLSAADPGFAGYKVFRAVGKADTVYEQVFSGGPASSSYEDTRAVRGFSYYYYVVAFNDGSNNSSGETNPRGPLYSSRFYTQTNEPAYLRRQAGNNLKDIRVVPNPYNIRARYLQYTGEPDKIMFLNIPAQCTIRIFTERGDLIQTIEHNNGSGDESWNGITSSRQVVVSGIYIAYFEVTRDYHDPSTGQVLYKKGENAFRKFVIIR